MRKVGVFSGSFNPIHLGHTRLADSIRREAGLDEVWLVVSPQNPLKRQRDLADEQHRLRMAQLAVSRIDGLVASDVEFGLPRPSYTWTTLSHLAGLHPDVQLSLIIGSDNMALFDRWYRWQDILEAFPVIVYPREGDDVGALRQRFPQMSLVASPLLPVSSTQIRQMIAAGTEPDEWIDPDVLAYIRRHRLYGSDSAGLRR